MEFMILLYRKWKFYEVPVVSKFNDKSNGSIKEISGKASKAKT